MAKCDVQESQHNFLPQVLTHPLQRQPLGLNKKGKAIKASTSNDLFDVIGRRHRFRCFDDGDEFETRFDQSFIINVVRSGRLMWPD